ncbi:MAG: hypothetical protein LBB23_02630 [Rickettsiales bacterium]|nr:hypothetical protein [Rickettsiales bacterium]
MNQKNYGNPMTLGEYNEQTNKLAAVYDEKIMPGFLKTPIGGIKAKMSKEKLDKQTADLIEACEPLVPAATPATDAEKAADANFIIAQNNWIARLFARLGYRPVKDNGAAAKAKLDRQTEKLAKICDEECNPVKKPLPNGAKLIKAQNKKIAKLAKKLNVKPTRSSRKNPKIARQWDHNVTGWALLFIGGVCVIGWCVCDWEFKREQLLKDAALPKEPDSAALIAQQDSLVAMYARQYRQAHTHE